MSGDQDQILRNELLSIVNQWKVELDQKIKENENKLHENSNEDVDHYIDNND